MWLINFLFNYFIINPVGRWAEKTFPQSTLITITTHLGREVKELKDKIDGLYSDIDFDEKGIMFELADCLLIIFHLAYRLRANLLKYAYKKYKINKTRKWANPDSEGVSEHIR